MRATIMKHALRNGSFALLALLAAACGGGAETEPKTAAAAAAPPPSAPPPTAMATTGSGQQYAAADTSAAGANRPQMNASAQQAYDAGLQAFQAGDLAGAKAQFARAADADANAYQAQYSLGVVQERLGQKSAALTAYKAAISGVKDFDPAIAAYALLLARTGDVSEAEDFLNRERATLPNSAAVLASLAEVKSIEKDSASAQSLAQEALKKNPDYRPAMVTLARDHYRNRRLDLALYTLTAILDGYGPENPARDKDNAEALLLRGLIYKEQGRRRDAFADFQRANQLRPDLVEAKINLARFMLDAGNATDATPLLESALGYDASNTMIHLDLGDAYRLQGRPADALKHFQWVLSKDPTVAEVHYNLGLLYLFSKNVPGVSSESASIDKAIGELQTFKSMRPRTKAGSGDDVDELLARATNKKAVLAAEAAAPPPDATPAPAATPAAGAAKSSSGAMPAAGAPAAAPAPAAKPSGSSGAMPPASTPAPAAPTAPAAPSPSGSSAAFPSK
ncbi:MAG TPA: tetratricopeptide repeat protein [Polyangiaceae bacterium]|jgi:tetratricopeptide (TPR) repeat protein|nr:tetratricopeptide repeat protein [Polyangiaceae bacterium]